MLPLKNGLSGREMVPKIVILCGPTAVGKSALSVPLARHFNMEIVNADSQLVWREFDIGTAKPEANLLAQVPHHLINVVSPANHFDVSQFVGMADDVIQEIQSRDKKVLVVGGTGMYQRILLHGICPAPPQSATLRQQLLKRVDAEGSPALYEELQRIDPDLALKIHPNDKTRIVRGLEVWQLTGKPLSAFQGAHQFQEQRYDALIIGLDVDRQLLRERINQRTDAMIEAGWLKEVKALVAKYGDQVQAIQSLGYRDLADYLKGDLSLDEAVESIKKKTHAFAKRQRTWFRGNAAIHWFTPEQIKEISELMEAFYGKNY